jgi:hypothetical protein
MTIAQGAMGVGRNYGPATDHDGQTRRNSTVNHGRQREVVHARHAWRPDLGVKGSRVQIRQPDSTQACQSRLTMNWR